jgi:hypothetical protein
MFAGTLLAPVAHAAEATLTITGSSPAWVDVRFTHSVALDLAHAHYAGRGPYTAVFVERVTPYAPMVDMLGVVERSVTPDPAHPVVDVLGWEPTRPLPAGSYRLYLFGGSGASVGIPAAGLHGDRTVRTTHPIPVSYRETALPATLSPGTDGVYHGESRLPVTLGPRPLVYHRAAVRFDAPGAERFGLTACLIPRGSADGCDYDTDYTGAQPTGHVNLADASYADAEIAANGQFDAVARFRGQPPPAYARVALLVVALSRAAAQPVVTL